MVEAALNRQYFINPRIMAERFIMALVAIIIVPVFLALTGEKVDELLIAIFAFLIVMVAVIFFVMRRLVRLVVTDDGVQMHTPGMHIITNWNNIESIGTRIMYGEGKVEGLVLREPAMEVAGVVRATRWFNVASWYTLKTYENFLPVSNIIGKDWRNTSFGEALRRHVPHLLADEGA